MPILQAETDLYPADLLEEHFELDEDARWWAVYTRSRREKQLMRHLLAKEIPFYGPTIARRNRSASGRVRESHMPLFANYVFVRGTEDDRYDALTSNCISQCIAVDDGDQLVTDLRQIQQLIDIGEPLTPESRIGEGARVRVTSGTFAGFEGTVVRRENETRLLVSVNFTQQGASVLLDDCQLEEL